MYMGICYLTCCIKFKNLIICSKRFELSNNVVKSISFLKLNDTGYKRKVFQLRDQN